MADEKDLFGLTDGYGWKIFLSSLLIGTWN